MRNVVALVGVVALLMSACGGSDLTGNAPAATVGSTAPESISTVPPVDPAPRDAARPADRVNEPALTPVPVPAPDPAAKPIRPGLPNPPPTRQPALSGDGPDLADITGVMRDLSTRLSIPVEEIDVLDARAVTWRNGSVGCPAEGMAYTQAEVPGGLIVLAVGDTSYRYHAGDGASYFLCETPEAPMEGSA
ncbi:MAG: hypothetical protein KJO17_10285 [Acidimicrobiia bacterium]|nr:hypothetical protein [Acidimicrobiia bacterium]